MAYSIVIGAGFTGLVAAYELAKKGKKVVLAEKGGELGGLLTSVKVGKSQVESCYHVLFPGNDGIINLIKELKLDDKLYWNTATNGFFYNGRNYSLNTPIDFLLYPQLNPLEKFRTGLLLLEIMSIKDTEKYDKFTAKEWITGKAGKSAYEKFFKPMIDSKFEGDSETISASWFIDRMKHRNKRNIKGEYLGYLRGGFHQLVERLEEELEKKGVIIIKNAKVKLDVEKNAVVSATINGKKYAAENVVSTIPPTELEKLVRLPKSFTDKFDMPYQGTMGLIVGSSKKINEFFWTNTIYNKRTFRAIVELTNLVPDSDYGMHIAYLSKYPNMKDAIWKKSDHEITRMYLDDLKKLLPHIKNEDIKYTYLYRNEFAGIIINKGLASRINHIGYKTPIGNLFIVGIFNQYPERLLDLSITTVNGMLKEME